jgi:perosamine synthetase
MIPIAQPAIGEEEIAAVADVLRSGMLAQGEVVARFEGAFARFCHADHAVAVNSGTAALHVALMALGIGPGDEVIVPSFTFIATASSVSMCGARPVFVDIDPLTFTLAPEQVEERVTDRTKAVIGVHLFGHPFDIAAIQDICEDRRLLLIEDAAQAHGARFMGEPVGGFGTVSCFSFYPTKNMTTGEGGMVVTGDPDIAERIRVLINHGQQKKYLHTQLGFNYRMTNIGAAIGYEQLKKLNNMNSQRRANAAYYTAHLTHPGIERPCCKAHAEHVYHQYVVKMNEEFPMTRKEFMEYLQGKGIGSAVHYPTPLHRQPIYLSTLPPVPCPVSDTCAGSVLSLPVHPHVGISDCHYICQCINEVD